MKFALTASALLLQVLPINGDGHFFGNQETSGAFYAVYNGTAPESCLMDVGAKVDDSCCSEMTPQPTINPDQSTFTCFAFNDATGAYNGCDGGMPIYGEGCAPEVNGTTMMDRTLNTTFEMCNCGFSVKGSGCFRVNDFPSPDPRQFFVYLDDHSCTVEEELTEAPLATNTLNSGAFAFSMGTTTVALGISLLN